MSKLLPAFYIAFSLFFAPGCTRSHAVPSASPVALGTDVEKYLQDFAKIKTEVHENLGNRYDRAADAQTNQLKLENPLPERQKAAPKIKQEMQEVTDGLGLAQKKIESLACPPACKNMAEHYLGYLKAMQRETRQCITLIDMSVNPKLEKKAYLKATHELEGINTSRNIEMANFVAEIKKIAGGQTASPSP